MRAPWLPKKDLGDAGLKLTGLVLAGGSMIFAAVMLSHDKDEPRITGVEHLAIYSKPATHLTARQREKPKVLIDDMPVGSIGKKRASAALTGYEILEASRGWALLRLPQGRIMRVSPGARIAGLGGVIAIERQGKEWSLVTEGGVIRAAREQRSGQAPHRSPH